MTHKHFRESWPGPQGMIELLFDVPANSCAIALIAHPNPALGGTAQHKVPAFLARTLRDAGWLTVRPNFRGVGGSEGEHDHGIGETDDLVVVAQRLQSMYPGLPLVLIGFSFGAYVQIGVARRLRDAGRPPARLVLVGAGIGQVEGGRYYDAGEVPPDTFVIHGENDERVALSNVFRWAEPQALPVTVVPGADHFFTGRLPVLAKALGANLNDIPADSASAR